METVIPKAWWTSKTFQGLTISGCATLYSIFAKRYHLPNWNDADAGIVTQVFQLIGAVITVIGLRTASTPIGDPTKPITVPLTPVGTASGNTPPGGQ